MSNKRTYYFGCIGEKGHYMFPATRRSDFPGANYKVIQYIGGLYTPGGVAEQGKAQFSMIGPFTIIAWHDYTVDSRPGSNSNIIGFGFTGTKSEIITDMYKDFEIRFPQVIKRQTTPVEVIDYGIIYKPQEVNNENTP